MDAFRLPDTRTLGAPVPPRELADLDRVAKEQFGLLTRRQCVGAGMSDDAISWRLQRGWWVTVHPGVYLTVPGRDDWWLRALAAQLAVDDAAWSHATAAFVHGLLRTPPRTLELLVGHDRRVSNPCGVLVHRRRGDVNRFVDELHWPWRTTVEETILDVCASTSVDETFALLGRAFQRRLTTEAALRGHLSLRARHPRRQLLELVLGDVADGAESAMEIRFVRDVERAHGLPHGRRQLSVHPDGRQIHDVGYVEQRVLVELDGRLGHEGPAARIQDGLRDRRGATSGWLTMRAFWRDVAGFPCDLAVETGAVLNSRGWRDRAHPCRRRPCAVAKGSLRGDKWG
jgi:very-short-patch-repair endonuclease